jgi:DNA-binding transcriptional regulator YiaG
VIEKGIKPLDKHYFYSDTRTTAMKLDWSQRKSVAAAIKRIRLRARLNQTLFGEAIGGFPQGLVSEWEAGTRLPNKAALIGMVMFAQRVGARATDIDVIAKEAGHARSSAFKAVPPYDTSIQQQPEARNV